MLESGDQDGVRTLDYAAPPGPKLYDLKAIAQRQRLLTIYFLVVFVGHFLVASIPIFAGVLVIALIAMVVSLSRLMTMLGATTGWKVATVCAMFVPLANLVILTFVNYRACEVLRAAGVRVGALGVSEDDIARIGSE